MKIHESITEERVVEALENIDERGFCVVCGEEAHEIAPCEFCGGTVCSAELLLPIVCAKEELYGIFSEHESLVLASMDSWCKVMEAEAGGSLGNLEDFPEGRDYLMSLQDISDFEAGYIDDVIAMCVGHEVELPQWVTEFYS